MQIICASATSFGFSKYISSDETCIVGGPAGDESGSMNFGWIEQSGELFYYSKCHDWEDPTCCEDICKTYDKETKKCLLKNEISEQIPEANKITFKWIYYLGGIFLFVVLVLFLKKRKINKH